MLRRYRTALIEDNDTDKPFYHKRLQTLYMEQRSQLLDFKSQVKYQQSGQF